MVTKTPPRYGLDLVAKARDIMYYALPLHMIIGFFMYTNTTTIFNGSASPELQIFDSTQVTTKSIIFTIFLSPERIKQAHGMLYLCATFVIIGCFIAFKIIGAFCEQLHVAF
jgi:hypothetical protein